MNVSYHNEVPAGYYGKLADAWLSGDEELQKLYPLTDTDIPKICGQYSSFDTSRREVLFKALMQQYEGIELHSNVNKNLQKLRDSNAYTVTTGQQIHIFLGPAFFIYKIASVIRHARRLQDQYPDKHFIPVFWMATEDHDVVEISSLDVFGKKYIWAAPEGLPTGRLSTQGLEELSELWVELGEKENVPDEIQDIFRLFKTAYNRFSTLSSATRFIIHELFGKYGLLVIDADQAVLKSELQTLALHDILTDSVYSCLQNASKELKGLGYGNQVNPRRTHFFLIQDGLRQRIDKVEDGFKLHPSGEVVSIEKMATLIRQSPELFSPNALLRPLYQQLILPNVAYVCGPSEIHYWHQLYATFKLENVVAPMLVLRDSFLMLDPKTREFLNKHQLSEKLMWQGPEVSAQHLERMILGTIHIDDEISSLKEHNEQVFKSLFALKFKDIKALRIKSESWMKELDKARKEILNEVRKQPAFEPEFIKLGKITTMNFNINSPQERSVSWIEFLFKFRQNPTDLLVEKTDLNHVFGTVYVQ